MSTNRALADTPSSVPSPWPPTGNRESPWPPTGNGDNAPAAPRTAPNAAPNFAPNFAPNVGPNVGPNAAQNAAAAVPMRANGADAVNRESVDMFAERNPAYLNNPNSSWRPMPINDSRNMAMQESGSFAYQGAVAGTYDDVPRRLKKRKVIPDPTLPPMPGQRQVTTIKYTVDMYEFIMDQFLAKAREGIFLLKKGHFYNEAWKDISDAMAAKFPRFGWTPDKVRNKFDTEKKKLRGWLNWRDQASGGTPFINGIAHGSFEAKEAFLARNPDHGWIFSTPLKKPERYLEIFAETKPTNHHPPDPRQTQGHNVPPPSTAAASTAAASTAAAEQHVDDSVYAPVPRATEGEDLAILPSPRTATDNRLPRKPAPTTTAIGLRPEDAAMISEFASALVQMAKAMDRIGDNMKDVIGTSKSAKKAIVEDFMNLFRDRLEPAQMLACVRRLEGSVTIWSELSAEVKEVYVNSWLADAGLNAMREVNQRRR